MSKVRIFGSSGCGDALQAFQCAHYVKQSGNDVDVAVFARNEVYRPLEYMFKDKFTLSQLPEDFGQDSKVEDNEDMWRNFTKGYDEAYFVKPDFLYLNRKRFDCKKYNVHPNTIRSTRLLTHKWKPENIVYLALNTSTQEYEYGHIPTLLKFIAETLPNYQIYFNNLTHWAGKGLNNGQFHDLPKNVLYFENQNFEESLEYLYKSCYCVCLDNGPSHISFQLGIPRLLISNRFNNQKGLIWTSRWYEDLNECISYDKTPRQIADLVKLNLDVPQSTLVPRMSLIDNLHLPINELLLFKF